MALKFLTESSSPHACDFEPHSTYCIFQYRRVDGK